MTAVPRVSNRLVKSVAIFSCIQALLWLALGITGLVFFNCGMEVGEKNPGILLVITYFYNPECRSPPSYLEKWWDPQEPPPKSRRTHTALVWFIASGAVRAAVALVLAVGAGRRRRLATAAGVLFWCWLLIDVACLVVDAIYAIIYAIDWSDAKSLADLLNDENLNNVTEETSFLWALVIPPLIMVLACSRIVILWVMEMVLVFVAIVGACRARKFEHFSSPPNVGRSNKDIPLQYTAAKAKSPTAAEEAAAVAAIATIGDEAAASAKGTPIASLKVRASSTTPSYEQVGQPVGTSPDELETAEHSTAGPYYSPPAADAPTYEPVEKRSSLVAEGGLNVNAGRKGSFATYYNAPSTSNPADENVYEAVDYSASTGVVAGKTKQQEQEQRLEKELQEQERWRQQRREEERREEEKLELARREQERREQELQRRAMAEREAVAAAAAAEQDRKERERKEQERARREKERERLQQLRRDREAAAAVAAAAAAAGAVRQRAGTADAPAAADDERRPKSGSVRSNKGATAELNNQKPWSYFRPPIDELPQRRLSPVTLGVRVEDNGLTPPPVPVPDYNVFSPIQKSATKFSPVELASERF